MFASITTLAVVPPFPTGPLPQLEGYTMVVPQSMSLLRQSGNSTLADAVFRTNHAVHPTLMATQEPLFNDTTFRYQLLRKKIEDASAGGAMDDAAAVQVAASLGIKGPDFLSCDAAQFGGGDNIMSIVYAPADAAPDDTARAWVAWEDKDAAGAWRPAACNAYVRVDLAGMW